MHGAKLSVIQPDVFAYEAEARLEKLRALAAQALNDGAEILLFPECVNVIGLPLESWPQAANGAPQFMSALADILRQSGAWAALPLLREGEGGLRNTVFLLDESGSVAGLYDKVHLTLTEVADLHMDHGMHLPVFQIGRVKAGILTCNDVYFPEAAQVLFLQGAQLVLFPSLQRSEEPEVRRALVRARAIDGVFHVARAAHAAPEAEQESPAQWGGSCIVDPRGNVLAEAGGEEGVVSAVIDVDAGPARPACYGKPPYPVRDLRCEQRRPRAYTALSRAPAPVIRDGSEISAVCAHRGASATHPENTLYAFQEAVRLKVEMIEFDAQLTSDGHVVLIHDYSVDRTTDGCGRVSDMTLGELKGLDASGGRTSDFPDCRIPTLKEGLEVVPSGILLNVHVKETGVLKDDLELAVKIMGMLREHALDDCAFLACTAGLMAELRSEGHDFAFCNMSGQSGPEYLEATLLSGAQFIQFPHQGVNAEFVERAHAGGLIVNVFYADEPEEMKRLIDYGVDYILTNHPERLGNLIVGLSA